MLSLQPNFVAGDFAASIFFLPVSGTFFAAQAKNDPKKSRSDQRSDQHLQLMYGFE